jgi:hypothetical protein
LIFEINHLKGYPSMHGSPNIRFFKEHGRRAAEAAGHFDHRPSVKREFRARQAGKAEDPRRSRQRFGGTWR